MAVILMCAAEPKAETTLRLAVPKKVAGEAAARMAGNALSPPPILMLEDVELGSGEGLTIRVLGPAEPGSPKPRPVFAESGMVGSRQKVLEAPIQKTTLAVPLNDEASHLLKDKTEVTLILQIDGSPGRPPLKLKRAYFSLGEPHAPAPPN